MSDAGMRRAVRYIMEHPGASADEVARAIKPPRGKTRDGMASVEAAIKNGWVKVAECTPACRHPWWEDRHLYPASREEVAAACSG